MTSPSPALLASTILGWTVSGRTWSIMQRMWAWLPWKRWAQGVQPRWSIWIEVGGNLSIGGPVNGMEDGLQEKGLVKPFIPTQLPPKLPP